MRSLFLILTILAAVVVAGIGSSTARAQTFQCAILDPPPAPYRIGNTMYGSARTICRTPAYKLQLVTCLVRYSSYGGSNPTPRGCTTSVCWGCTDLRGTTQASCNWTTYPYVWRTSSYAIATIGGGTFKSPVALSGYYVATCA